MSITMNSDLSTDEVQILRAMWELKALGTRTVPMRSLASRVPNALEKETNETVKSLEARGMVTRSSEAEGDLLALSPLGVAFVRQLQDGQLGDLSRGT